MVHAENVSPFPFFSLSCLGLADNALSDDGIQRLTAPLRMFGKGATSLQYLVLAGKWLGQNPSLQQCFPVFSVGITIIFHQCTNWLIFIKTSKYFYISNLHSRV
jgi:hypothetical protein